MSKQGNEWGAAGENLATEHLIKEGYTIRERNWKCGKLEIDIIAQTGSMIVFVEVKSRNGKHGDPLDAIDSQKINRIVNAANIYMKSIDYDMDSRFDVIAITGNANDYTLEHIPDAFFPPLRSYR